MNVSKSVVAADLVRHRREIARRVKNRREPKKVAIFQRVKWK